MNNGGQVTGSNFPSFDILGGGDLADEDDEDDDPDYEDGKSIILRNISI